MNTINANNFKSLSVARYVELGVYIALAAWLISHIFNPSVPFTTRDFLTVLSGVAFGMLAACGVTPVADVLRWGITRSNQGPVLEKASNNNEANVIPILRHNSRGNQSSSENDDAPRRAA